MKVFVQSRSTKVMLLILLATAIVASLPAILAELKEAKFEGKAKIREGGVQAANVSLSPIRPVSVKLAGPSGFPRRPVWVSQLITSGNPPSLLTGSVTCMCCIHNMAAFPVARPVTVPP